MPNHSVAHRGIQRFFKRGVLFALPIVLVLGYAEYRLRAIPNSYNMKRVYLERQLDSIEVLVLGSSQSFDGINPDRFCCRGFNLADVGQTLFYDVRLASRYIPRMPRLRVVVIPLSYFSFGYNLEDTGESWRDYYYYHFWDIKASDIKWYDSRSVSFIALYTTKTVLRFAAHGFNVNEAAGMQTNGWHRTEGTSYESINDSLGHERVKIHDILNNPSRFEGNLRELTGLLGELKMRGIAVEIITPPVYSTYAKYTNPVTLAFNRHLIDSLCTVYGCTYADFFKDQRFVISDFNDNDHLNFAGAEKLSKIVNDEVLSRLCGTANH